MEKNGSGKSTILELLLRFYEPEEGEILCNGENIKVLKLSEYRSLFSVVSQKSALFLGDIVQNIDLEGKADRQKLNEVLRKSGVKKYLQRFPEKEKTQIGDDGAFLSGGERQKLVVARALLKDAPVMLFDEARKPKAQNVKFSTIRKSRRRCSARKISQKITTRYGFSGS